MASEALPEHLQINLRVNGLRALRSELRNDGEIRAGHQIDFAHSLVVMITQLVARCELQTQTEPGPISLGRRAVLEPSGQHEVKDQMVILGQVEDEKLSLPAKRCDGFPLRVMYQVLLRTAQHQVVDHLNLLNGIDAGVLLVEIP